jgi:hypothetical protein
MTRYIDANAFKKENERLLHCDFPYLSETTLEELIDEAPTIDAEPVRHGKWKWLSCTYDRVPKEKEYECSECHHKTIVHGDDMPWEKYCPNCGARMDKDD